MTGRWWPVGFAARHYDVPISTLYTRIRRGQLETKHDPGRPILVNARQLAGDYSDTPTTAMSLANPVSR